MKIFGYNDNISKVYKPITKPTRPKDEKTPVFSNSIGKKDEVVISSNASEVRRLGELTKTFPEVREDKVTYIKEKIQNSAYTVNGKAVAESILDLVG